MLPRLVDAVSHGSKRITPTPPTNSNICRLWIRPSGECGRAGNIYYSLIARRSKFGTDKVPIRPVCFRARCDCECLARKRPGVRGHYSQLRLLFLPGCEALLQICQRNGVDGCPQA